MIHNKSKFSKSLKTCLKNGFFKIETLKSYNIQNIAYKIIEFL